MNSTFFDWEATASYLEFLPGILSVYRHAQSVAPHPASPQAESHWSVIGKNRVGVGGVAAILGLALGLTAFRMLLNSAVLQPILRRYRLRPSSQAKVAESVWKLAFHTCTTCWSFYSAVYSRNYLQKPSTFISNLEHRSDVPRDIQFLYAFVLAYYLQATYSLFFVDTWKKDSKVMTFHHLMTMTLLAVSYCIRYTKVGVVIILLHDGCDILFEVGMVLMSMRVQDGKFIRSVDTAANLTGAVFFFVWCLLRLYYYPLRVIHTLSTGIVTYHLESVPFVYSSYLMTLFLLALDLFWTWLFIKMVMRVFTGKMSTIDDTREDGPGTALDKSQDQKTKDS